MPLMIPVVVSRNEVPALINNLAVLLGSRRVNEVAAVSGSKLTKQHLRDLDGQRANPLGGKRSHFYAKFAAETRPDFSETRAAVLIGNADFGGANEGNALWKHYTGGEIHARPGHALAIPVNPAAYGVAPRTFALTLIVAGNKHVAMLVKSAQSALQWRTGKDGKQHAVHQKKQMTMGEVFYLLLKKITLRRDPSVLPTEMEYAWAVEAGLRQLAARYIQ